MKIHLQYSILITIFILILNSVYANKFHNQNKPYIGQLSPQAELRITDVRRIYYMENQIEIFKDITGFEGRYQVSDLGRVKSLSRYKKSKQGQRSYIIPERILKLRKDKDGYVIAHLMVDGKNYTLKVHRLVATVFIPNPENKPCINHINCIRHENSPENLEWCTMAENYLYAVKMGNAILGRTGRENWRSRKVIVEKDGVYNQYDSLTIACNEIGVSIQTLLIVLQGKRETTKGYKCQYA